MQKRESKEIEFVVIRTSTTNHPGPKSEGVPVRRKKAKDPKTTTRSDQSSRNVDSFYLSKSGNDCS
jgi:hypothetical protein